jgi:hypothetical protein
MGEGMKVLRLYILPLCLLLASIFLLAKGIKIKKDSQTVWKGIVNSLVQQQINATIAPDDAKMISIRKIVVATAGQYDIPVTVALRGPTMSIKPDITQIKPGEVLDQESNIYGFINTLSALPYRMQYESFCIGTGCGPEGFTLSVTVKGV